MFLLFFPRADVDGHLPEVFYFIYLYKQNSQIMQRDKPVLEKITDALNADNEQYLDARAAKNRNTGAQRRSHKAGKYSRAKSPKVPSIKKIK